MELSRRGFLRGLVAVTAAGVVSLPAVAEAVPQLWGDGVHDDAGGLEALFNGRPVEVMNGLEYSVAQGRVTLGAAHFRLCRGIVINGDDVDEIKWSLSGGRIEKHGDFREALITISHKDRLPVQYGLWESRP